MVSGDSDGLILLQEMLNNFLNQYWEGECEDGVLLCVPNTISKLILDFLIDKLEEK